MNTQEIANCLIKLCEKKKFKEARQELYAENALSTEADSKEYRGLKTMNEKEKHWHASIEEIHDITISKPLIIGNFFSLAFTWDMTYKGKDRNAWEEIAVFKVKGEKVVLEKFYY